MTRLTGDEVAQHLRRALAGEQGPWDVLVGEYNDWLWRLARRTGLGHAAAQDAVQTTWLRLLQHGTSIREPEKLGGWLATTLKREVLRNPKRHQQDVQLEGLYLADEHASPEEEAMTHDRDRLLWEAVEQLSERCRQLLRLLTNEPPASYQDISIAMSMPIGSIGTTRRRCLQALRLRLRDSFPDL